VEGNFASWSFTKCGVRAPGEGKCNGTNDVMMKLPSQFYSTTPIYYNVIQVGATVFNTGAYTAKYSLEYSVDGGTTWTKVITPAGNEYVEVAAQSTTTVTWPLTLSNTQGAQFRVAQVGGNKSASTYLDDLTIFYEGEEGNPGGVEGRRQWRR